MTSVDENAPLPDGDAPSEDEAWTEAADASLAADDDARFFATGPRRKLSRRFIGILALVLLVHAALIAAFLWRDRTANLQVAQQEEATPVEVVVEQPPEPPKPPPPPEQKPPEPPRPKEDLSPAMSAPRAPAEDKIKTETKEAKTEAPTKLATPTQGAPQAAAPAAPEKEATPEANKEDAAKEEEKKEAEALDKARRKADKKKTREAKAHSSQKVNPNLLAALGGAPSFGAHMTFARPTPKTKIYGGTEDVRWMSEVEAMLEAKVQQLPKTAHYQAGGKVAICFHVSPEGRVILQEYCAKSGYPDIDQLAMRALRAAAPFPPPPPGLDRGLIWVSTFDGQTPVLHFR